MDELTARRLAVIRHLFEKGKELSYEGEPMKGLCLLPFHDSVEMFMKLCADKRGVSIPRNTPFMDYYKMLPDLQDKAQMESLNARRVSLNDNSAMNVPSRAFSNVPSVTDSNVPLQMWLL